MTADFTRPPPVLPLCENHHVACVQAEDVDGLIWCWGWHLVAFDDEWREIVADDVHMLIIVTRLIELLVEHEINHTACTFIGRGL